MNALIDKLVSGIDLEKHLGSDFDDPFNSQSESVLFRACQYFNFLSDKFPNLKMENLAGFSVFQSVNDYAYKQLTQKYFQELGINIGYIVKLSKKDSFFGDFMPIERNESDYHSFVSEFVKAV